jgi:hypothetical protein
MAKFKFIFMIIGLLVVAGCSSAQEEANGSVSPVNTPDDDQVGESELTRETDKIVMNFEACCAVPGNAYTAWWLIGDVELPMSSVETPLAEGWVAESEEFNLALELKVGEEGLESANDGIRLIILDHGANTGNPCSSAPLQAVAGLCVPKFLELLTQRRDLA